MKDRNIIMTKDKKRTLTVALATLLGCAVMAVVDGVISPPYAVKSIIKVLIFGGLPILYSVLFRENGLKKALIPQKRGLLLSLLLGALVYAFIIGGYFLLRGIFDFSAITASLVDGEGVTRDNFLFVAAYISVCNSFLEEFFFRGFAFHVTRSFIRRGVAYTFSAAAFAVYHVAIMSGWFDPVLFILLLIGLFIGGIIFNFLDEKTGDIYPSWIVHMFANFGINTIGCILFGII